MNIILIVIMCTLLLTLQKRNINLKYTNKNILFAKENNKVFFGKLTKVSSSYNDGSLVYHFYIEGDSKVFIYYPTDNEDLYFLTKGTDIYIDFVDKGDYYLANYIYPNDFATIVY